MPSWKKEKNTPQCFTLDGHTKGTLRTEVLAKHSRRSVKHSIALHKMVLN